MIGQAIRFQRCARAFKQVALFTTGLLGILPALPTQAQAEPPAKASPGQPTVAATISEVVVTAQRRSERLVDVPISVSAIDAQTITRTGASNLEDIGRQLANVALPDSSLDSRPQISIRGVSSNVRNLGFEDGVVVYVDQVPVGSREGFNVALDDVQQIEVLRGPQGTLYGKNSISGAINITTIKPDYDAYAGSIRADFGRFDLKTLRATANVPIVVGEAALRLSASHMERDGYVTNVFNGSKLNSTNEDTVRAQFRANPTDNFTVLLEGDYLRSNRSIAPQEPLSGAGFVPGPYTVNYNAPTNREDRDIGGGALTLDYDIADGSKITSITAYRSAKVHLAYDQDLSPLDLFTIDFHDKADQFSQEVRLASPSKATWGDFVVGGQYFWQKATFNRPVPGGSLFGGGLLGTNVGEVTTNTYALFGHLDVKLADRLTAFGGLRYTLDKKQNQFEQIFTPTGAAVFGLPSIPSTSGRRKDENLTFALGLRYAPTTNSSAYVSITSGFKGGGFNDDFVSSTNPDGFSFGPEKALNYEVGYKGDFFDRRLTLSTAAFYLDYKDLQVSNFNGLSFVIKNAASARSEGAEVEVTARPISGLTLNASAGYTDAIFKKYVFAPGMDFSGHPLLRAPKWTASASAEYDLVLSGGMILTPRLDYTYVSSQFSTAAADSSSFIPASSIVDARLILRTANGRWEASLWGKNLMNRHPIADAFSFLGGDVVDYAAPRTYGVELAARF